jgi:hypothetical protein
VSDTTSSMMLDIGSVSNVSTSLVPSTNRSDPSWPDGKENTGVTETEAKRA